MILILIYDLHTFDHRGPFEEAVKVTKVIISKFSKKIHSYIIEVAL